MKLTTGFKKPVDSDDYVLLAGGGHKALSEFNTSEALDSKTYEIASISGTVYMPFLRFIPDDASHQWHIIYKIDAKFFNGTAATTYNGEYYVEFYGYNRTIGCYKIWNSFRSGYPVYYHTFFQNKTDANQLTQGSFFGIYFNSISTAVNAYKRIIKVDLVDYYGCTVEFLPEMKNYNSTYNLNISGTATDINIYSNTAASNYNGTSQGLQETGDADNTITHSDTYGYMLLSSTSLRLNGYGLFGYNPNGEIESFGAYGTAESATMRTIAQGDRLITTNGIDWTRGIWYLNNNADYAPGARMAATKSKAVSGCDLRYTFNTYNHNTTASPLGIVRDKLIYLKGYLKNNLFYFYPDTVTHSSANYYRAWTQDIPTSEEYVTIDEEDCHIVYWLIGSPYYNSSNVASGYQVNLYINNPLYWFHNGQFRKYVIDETKLVTTDTQQTISGEKTFDLPITGNLLGNATTADRLKNARTISLTGNVTGSGTFDGSGNLSISTTVSGGSATDSTKVAKAGDTMTGQLVTAPATGNTALKGIKLGDATLSSVQGKPVFFDSVLRFTDGHEWDWDKWAGLKYNSANKNIYLGLADGTIFNANAAQSGGSLILPGVSSLKLGGITQQWDSTLECLKLVFD